MFNFFFVFLLSFLLQERYIPYKPNEQFELKLDYSFKPRPAQDPNTVDLTKKNTSYSGPLPFLAIEFKTIKLEEGETRLKIIKNGGDPVLSKKIQEQQVVKFDMGFTADLKDRVQPNEYTLYFLTADKKEKSKVVISVAQDGTFLVNEEKRGKL